MHNKWLWYTKGMQTGIGARVPRDLTQAQVDALKKIGTHRAAKMLYVRVASPTCRLWTFRYSLHGRRHWLGLGPVDQRSCKEAIGESLRLRIMLADGGDPLAHKAAKQARETETRLTQSFEACCAGFLADKRAGMAERSANEFLNIFKMHCGLINKMPVSAITSPNVAAVLNPLRLTKAATERKLQNRIERVLGWAKAKEFRAGDNPATKDALRDLQPSRREVVIKHLESLAWEEVPRFVSELTKFDSMHAKALLFTVLSAGRTAETLGARWAEIDLGAGVWTIPKTRMKGRKKEHRVLLTPRMINLLQSLPPGQGKDFVFRKHNGAKLNGGALRYFKYRNMPLITATVHGFRGTFSTWCADTGKDDIAAEHALSHAVGNTVARAYQKSDLLERRRPLMLAWEAHCFTGTEGSDAAPLGGERGVVPRQVNPRKISLAI